MQDHTVNAEIDIQRYCTFVLSEEKFWNALKI